MEFDTRASMFVGSFLDMSGAPLSLVLSAVIEVDGISEKTRDAIQHALDFKSQEGRQSSTCLRPPPYRMHTWN